MFVYWTILKKYTILPVFMQRIVYCYLTIIWVGFYSSLGTLDLQGWSLMSKSLVTIGYGFFVCSDSILAVNLWVKTNPFIHFLVMFTYYVAQFCIAVGYVLGINGLDNLIPF